MSGKRALTATGPSQSAVAPRQGRRRSVPTEPVADGPFTGPSTATGPFRLVTGPVGTGLKPSVCAPSQPETIQTAQTTATGPPARRCRTVPAAPDAPSPLPPPLGQRRAARSGRRRPQRRGARGRRGRGGGRRLESTLPLTGQLSGTGLHIGALNIQSLKPKLLELTDAITRYDYDVLLLSETWLRPSTPNRLLVIPGYAISRADRPDGRGYGGVAIVTKAGITSMALKLPNSKCPGSLLESQWAQLKLPKNRQLIVGSLYRPPRHSVAALRADFADLETQLQQIFINHPKVPLVICGDLNCDMLKSPSFPA